MAEQDFSTSFESLATAAKKHEKAGQYKEAALDYMNLLALEEICGFPKPVIEFEQENVIRCQTKHLMEIAKPKLEAMGNPQEATEVCGVNTAGVVHDKTSETVIIDTEKLYKEKQAASKDKSIHGRPHWAQSAEKAVNPKPASEEKTSEPIIFTTKDAVVYPSKGCP